MSSKICKHCLIVQPLDAFHKNSRMRDGYFNVCKVCTSKAHHENYLSNKGRYLKQTKAYYFAHHDRALEIRKKYKQTKKGIKMQRELVREYRKNHPETVIAHNAVKRKAVAGCAYPQGKCEGRLERHHWDYSKPKEFVCFCRKHHILADNVRRLILKTAAFNLLTQ